MRSRPGEAGRLLVAVMVLAAVCAVPSPAKSISVPSDAATISAAVLDASDGDTVWVDDGVYKERVLLPHGVALMSRTRFKAIIDGGGRNTVVTLGKNNLVVGFEIRNGTIGVFSNGSGNVMRFCRVVNNWQTGVVCVRHLPTLEDNIIAFNRGSGIQGWDVRSSVATINHNTIAYNGNHGLAVGGASSFVVENNIIAYNERFALRIHEESEKSVRVSNNNIYQNLNAPGGVPEGNFSFDPAFKDPRTKKDFAPNPERCCTIKGTDNENLGARLMY